MNKIFILDLIERAAWTFGQAFVAAISIAYAGAGLDAEHLTDWSAWQKIITAAVIAGAGAVLSLVKSIVAGAITGSASTSKTVAESGPASTQVPAPHVPEHEAP